MNNPIVDKSFSFAVKIVNLTRSIRDKKEYELARQVLRCGTSIGANVAEAQKAQSERDFLAKIYVSYKEASEAEYWIRLLYATKIISVNEYQDIIKDVQELLKILSSITKTMEERLGITK